MKRFTCSYLQQPQSGIQTSRRRMLAPDLTLPPNPDATLAYIHSAWDTLTRSMTDCHSLVDIKVTVNPVIYMPAEVAARLR